MNNNRKNQNNKPKHTINQNIRSNEVRLVGDGESKVVKTSYALSLAIEEEKDLIIINENQNPPIAKIEDYKKFLYDLQKLEKEKKKNSSKSVVKEIQLSVEIGENDLLTKSKKALEFLEKGHKVKCSMILKGRQKATPERGEITMLKFAESLSERGSLESMPVLQGGRWNMMIKPKR